MAGSMYLSRLTEFKNQKAKTRIEEGQEHIQSQTSDEEQFSSPGSVRAREKQPYNDTRVAHFVPREMKSSHIEYSEPASPMRLNQYGIPEVIASDLGDSFAQDEPWRPNRHKEDEDEDLNHGQEGMMGLLNQFYDLNNNPTV